MSYLIPHTSFFKKSVFLLFLIPFFQITCSNSKEINLEQLQDFVWELDSTRTSVSLNGAIIKDTLVRTTDNFIISTTVFKNDNSYRNYYLYKNNEDDYDDYTEGYWKFSADDKLYMEWELEDFGLAKDAYTIQTLSDSSLILFRIDDLGDKGLPVSEYTYYYSK